MDVISVLTDTSDISRIRASIDMQAKKIASLGLGAKLIRLASCAIVVCRRTGSRKHLACGGVCVCARVGRG